MGGSFFRESALIFDQRSASVWPACLTSMVDQSLTSVVDHPADAIMGVSFFRESALMFDQRLTSV